MMKRVKIALKNKIKIWSYLGKLEEKFKTLIKQVRRGYWGWSSGKTLSAQPQHEAPGEFTNLFHQSKFRQTSVSVCVPASGQGGQARWTPQEPSRPKPGNCPWHRRTWCQEREHTRGISTGSHLLLQEKPAKPQLGKHSNSWTDTQRKNTGKRDQQHHWKCLSLLKLLFCNF